ncbi:MAG: endopeptidase La [bacterium]|nr:MAG: endopeptidase La [bacterium]
MLIPLMLTDENLIRLVDEALAGNKIIGVFTQKDRDVPNPGPDDIYQVGCAMLIQKMTRFPDGHIRIIGQGLIRIKIDQFTDDLPFIRAQVTVLEEREAVVEKAKALMRNVTNAFIKVVEKTESYPDELKGIVMNVKSPGRLADLLAANLDMEISERQKVLELLDTTERLSCIYEHMNKELEILRLGEKIKKDVRTEMDREQREYYLRQQIKAIRRELGEEDLSVELDDLMERIIEALMPGSVREAAFKELKRLQRMTAGSAEYVVARTYLDWLLDLPWEISTEETLDIAKARRILNRDHYDLDQVKERILEFLSVKKLRKGNKGTILCFVGPPGVGKTSLGRSIASALGRRFVRNSLGGIRDEAEIRGHRRTYIGALPGRIIQGIRTAGSNNPVFMLDEIDKVGSDFRGDPAAALLEVLDPEHNSTFADHYINLPFDLSNVFFITTANVRDTIPSPLLDRMEVLDLPGYIGEEKVRIARRYLVPRQLEENGISTKRLRITDEAIRVLIERYTREAGVRNLERAIASIARKVAMKLVEGKRGPYTISARNIKSYLGPEDYPSEEMLSSPEIGVATGMAKSASGGVILFIEALKMRGRGTLRLTGHLGDVMKESAEAALSLVKSRFSDTLVEENIFDRYDIHLHIPAGAVPKDGPSAGIAIAAALASLMLERPVRNDVAMTGEITLTGKVLPVGALKDKVIAARRAGIREIILPQLNRKDLEEIPVHIKKGIEFRFIERVGDGIAIALVGGKGPKGKAKKRILKYAGV